MTAQQLQLLAYQCLIDNSAEHGFNASSKQEIYGCFFGRDSLLTSLKILRTHSRNSNPELLAIVKRSLLTLINLQGKEINKESGEAPGKFIHEFRQSGYDHLIKLDKPWFIYPDSTLKNYDSIDSTPLGLITIYRYWDLTQDQEFLTTILPNIELALNWLINYGDLDQDGFIEYTFADDRSYGGLIVQSWTDSHEALCQIDGNMPKYPIAPVEVQAYGWLALKLWASFFLNSNPEFAGKLLLKAEVLKKQFNEKFIFKSGGYFYAAQSLDGNKKQIQTITANPLLCLWAAYVDDYKAECIVEEKYIPDFVTRVFAEDLFDDKAGIRTMSTLSDTFNSGKDSYHNGSFWPILNSLVQEGLENFGYIEEAERIKEASLNAIRHFQSPIELYVKSEDGQLVEYQSKSGQLSCRWQTWSAAALLDWII